MTATLVFTNWKNNPLAISDGEGKRMNLKGKGLDVAEAIEALFAHNAKQATLYLSRDFVVCATRQGRWSKRDKAAYVILKVGAPNYAQRKHIARLIRRDKNIRAEEIHLTFPKKRKSAHG